MTPRGIRNQNPGNIRRSSVTWEGQSPTQDDPDFVQFIGPQWGIRAIVRIMRSYKREGLNTLQAAIHRWAPPTENDTWSYVDAVCKGCGKQPDDVVDFDAVMAPLVKAIILHENGEQPYSDELINEGISLA